MPDPADEHSSRLLYLASIDLPHRKARAIQIINTSHALAIAGAQVTLVGGSRGPGGNRAVLEPFGLEPHQNLHIRRLPILRLPGSLDRWYTRAWQASYLAGLTLAAPDLIRSVQPDAILVRDLRLAWILTSLGPRSAQRVMFEAHDLSSYEAEIAGNARAARSLRDVEARVFSRAAAIITITSTLRDLITEQHQLDPARLRVIADGTSLPRLPVADATKRNGVYYVGQVYPWKGVDTLVRAASLCPQADFQIIGGTEDGTGTDQNVELMHALAAELGVADRVHFPGWVPYHRVPDILSRARVAVIPLPDSPFGRYFTSPLKLFDYMAAGVPIVASDLPALGDVLRHERNALLVTPGDPAALASAIQRLLSDTALANRLAAQAHADVSAYSWANRARHILQVVDSVTAGSAA
jgi:glycosyltransferase involved in cell wall biosynthesis